jgi:hypothetical protein
MTDAAVVLTQSMVERFTEQYLQSLGCTISKDGHRWNVTIPEDAETELPVGEIELLCGSEATQENSERTLLHAESEFFQDILEEAIGAAPSGKIILTGENTDVQIPDWLQKSPVTLRESEFIPYYDRTAIVVLFRASIETVSEYQKELLRAVAVDARSKSHLPNLEETFLRKLTPGNIEVSCESPELRRDNAIQLVEVTQKLVADQVQPEIDEIHQEASRAAEAEVEEYRQMQEQRIQELQEQHSEISSKIETLSEEISSTQQDQRVQALQERKELKREYEDVESELSEIETRRDRGFPERQREIRQRHALDVSIRPLTLSEIEYERGDIEFILEEDGLTRSITTGYGIGLGVTEEIHCDSCNQPFADLDHLQTIREGVQCEGCSSTGS